MISAFCPRTIYKLHLILPINTYYFPKQAREAQYVRLPCASSYVISVWIKHISGHVATCTADKNYIKCNAFRERQVAL